MTRYAFLGDIDSRVDDAAGNPVASRHVRFYADAGKATEYTDLASDAAGTGAPLTVLTNSYGYAPTVYLPDGVDGSDTYPVYVGGVDQAGNPPPFVVRVYSHQAPGGGGGGVAGVASFNTRTGAVTLTKTDVTGTGLAASDVNADAAGAAAAVLASSAQKTANLSDLGNAATARTNLGLGTAATHPATDFDTAGAAAAALQKTANLSDLANAAAARTNLGLGSAATQPTSAFDAAGAAAGVQTNLTAEIARAQNAEAAITNGLKNTQAAVVATTNQALTGLPTVDGVTLTAGQVILLAAQSSGSQNGLWSVAAGAWSRPANFAAGTDATGTNCWIESGTSNASSSWVVTGTTNNVVGTNVLTWQQTSGLGEVTVNAPLTKTGNTLGMSSSSAAGSYTNAAVTVDGFGRVTAASSGAAPPILARTTVKTGSYTAAPNDLIPVDTTSAAVTVTLPTAPADKTLIAVKHIVQGGTNAVTINRGGSDVFNKTGGATALTLALANQGVLLQYDTTSAVWTVVADDIPLSMLDARYDASGAAAAKPSLEGTTAPPLTNTTGSVLGTGTTAAHADHTHAIGTHDHSTTAKGGQLTPTTGLAATGTPSATTYLRGDNTWSTPAGGSAAPGMAMRFASGRYVASQPGAVTTGNLSNTGIGFIVFNPVTFPRSLTLTTIGIEVTTAVASSTVRLGLYTDSSGVPGTLVADFGTVDSSTTGVKTLTVSQAVNADHYWLACVQQGGASAVAVRQTSNFGLASDSRTTVPTAFVSGTLESSSGGVTGALASTVAIANGSSNGTRFILGV